MKRTLAIATVIAATLTLPATAEDAKIKVDPATGPTSIMTDAVPPMKRDAEAINDTSANAVKPLPSSKSMGEAVPSMRPTDAISGQPEAAASSRAATLAPGEKQSAAITLNEQEALAWVDKAVDSSDGKELGEVVTFQRDAANKVIGLHADIGGFLGVGETRVSLTAAQFRLQGDRVVLHVTAAQATDLPKVQK